ncbi:hypothetical protein [Bradyrhizobium sp. JR3.5]
MLLGLLFLADWYFPATPIAVAHDDIDRATIRIRSQHKWPEPIRMDTSTPLVTISPAPPAPIIAAAPAPEAKPAAVVQADTPRSIPSKAPEQATRHARSTRHTQRERSRRFAQRGQRYASYRAPDRQRWPFPSW